MSLTICFSKGSHRDPKTWLKSKSGWVHCIYLISLSNRWKTRAFDSFAEEDLKTRRSLTCLHYNFILPKNKRNSGSWAPRTARFGPNAEQESFQKRLLGEAGQEQSSPQPAAFCKHPHSSQGLGIEFSGAKTEFWADDNLHVVWNGA